MVDGQAIEVRGTCDERFSAVRDALGNLFANDLDTGASVAVRLEGESVVDLWGGHLDTERTTPWASDTIVNVFSTTKTMTALSALLLADRGELDLNAKVVSYWPEFAANGKADVEVRHLMSHAAGLPGWDEPLVVEDVYDWEKCTSLLAAQAPWWEPGTASGYHAVSQGFLIGEVVRRITGTTLGTFFAKEIAEPLGADFHIGLSRAHDGRVGRLIPSNEPLGALAEPGSIAARATHNPPVDGSVSWAEGWRRAEIPAGNGHGNARSVALVQAIVSNGGEVGGVRLLSEAGCARVLEEQTYGVDLVFGTPMRYGMGYGLNSPDLPVSPNPRTCFWGGWGGSIVINDLDRRLTVAYVMNRMGGGTTGDLRGASIVGATYGALAAIDA